MDDDVDVDMYADADATSDSDAAPSSSAGRISRAARAALLVEDDWRTGVYEARQARVEMEVEGEAAEAARSDVTLEGGLRVPARIHAALLGYQRVGLTWLWGLYRQRVGGILGDEMGLGKTAQVAALLGALQHSHMLKPSLVVCPATVISHWVRELQVWHPQLRVLVLHDSSAALRTGEASRKDIIRSVLSHGDVLITTYEGLRISVDMLARPQWDVVVLDEGHRVRNPYAAITKAVKQLHSVHRFILTGAPIQNRLKELWSLFDFVYPGRLGALDMFDRQFSAPIAAGGWTHATPLQVATAYQCALVLRDLINPYLLRRLKRDVNAQLPPKTEQVLFCRLSATQRAAYLRYLASREVGDVLEGRLQAFRAVGILRKTCNHTLLLEGADVAADAVQAAKSAKDVEHSPLLSGSGKMMVLAAVLKQWRAEGHRVLLFSQGTRMLDLLEAFVRLSGYLYLRMDGATPIRDRQVLVDMYNTNPDWFVFLLTTRVGGVGVNLIGADRVIIFDPDWNPSTDTQARERAWRIGQTKHVLIYRLITAGTIEEKIYHRQIFKNALTQRVLSDPSHRRAFDFRDLRELFTLTDDGRTADAPQHESANMPTLRTETEWMHPEGTIELGSDLKTTKARAKHAFAAPPGDAALADLVAGAEDFIDPDSIRAAEHVQTRKPGSPSPDGYVTDDQDDVEHILRGRDIRVKKRTPHVDSRDIGHALQGRDAARSHTLVLQALYGQGELAGAFSHDSVELAGLDRARQSELLAAGKRVAAAAAENLARATAPSPAARISRKHRTPSSAAPAQPPASDAGSVTEDSSAQLGKRHRKRAMDSRSSEPSHRARTQPDTGASATQQYSLHVFGGPTPECSLFVDFPGGSAPAFPWGEIGAMRRAHGGVGRSFLVPGADYVPPEERHGPHAQPPLVARASASDGVAALTARHPTTARPAAPVRRASLQTRPTSRASKDTAEAAPACTVVRTCEGEVRPRTSADLLRQMSHRRLLSAGAAPVLATAGTTQLLSGNGGRARATSRRAPASDSYNGTGDTSAGTDSLGRTFRGAISNISLPRRRA